MEDKINDLSRLLSYEKIYGVHNVEEKVINLLNEIFEKIIAEDIPNRQDISFLIGILEKFDSRSLSYLLKMFFDKFEIIKNKKIIELDRSIVDKELNEDIQVVVNQILENSLKKNNKLQISNYSVDFGESTREQQEDIFSFLLKFILEDELNFKLNDEKINDLHLFFTLARQFAIKLDRKYVYYVCLGSFIARLDFSEKYQYSRDFVEDVLRASYIDDCKDAGFYLVFKTYALQSSTIAAAVYLNLLSQTLIHKNKIHNHILKELIWDSIKYFRNIKLIPFAKRLYHNIPDNIFKDTYEKLSIDHTYYSTLLHETPDELPQLVFDYINKNREEILSYGPNDVLPWLITLYNIKSIYSDRMNISFLDTYIELFENIVLTPFLRTV